MTRRLFAFFSLPVVVVSVGLTGCNINISGPIQVTKPFTGKAVTTVPADLHVNIPVGEVIIKAGSADSTEVSVTGTLGAQDQTTLDAVNMSVVQDASGTTTVEAKGPNGKSWKADLTIIVPPKTTLKLEAGVGSVTVSGLEGRMTAALGVGDLNFEDLKLTGDSSFNCGTGNVTLGIASWPKDSKVKAESGTGNARVKLPAGLGVNVNASTGTGNLSTTGLKFPSAAKSKSVVGGSLKGRTEADPEGRTLKISSGTGNVTIESSGGK
jgi:DUF4097 and DUF4098 domain-containing protein YvlB